MMLFSCNVTKHLGENKKLLVKNKVIVDKSDLNKKDAGFEEYEIEQLIKPKPNTKSVLLGIRMKLWLYHLYSENEIEEKVNKKEVRCSKIKSKQIASITKKIKHFENKIETNPDKSNKYLKNKLKRKQEKKEKKEENICAKQHWTKKQGEPPVIFNINDAYRNKRKIRVFLKNKGYYTPVVNLDTVRRINYFQEIFIPELALFSDKNKIKKAYNNYFEKKVVLKVYISPGQVFKIDKISYNISNNNIRKILTNDITNSLLKTGNRLDIQDIEDERKRISDHLRDLGYYTFSKDYIYFSIDTIGKTNQADIEINISKMKDNDGEIIAHKKHIIQNVFIYPYFKPNEALINKNNYYNNHDTIIYYSKDHKKYNIIYKDIPRINPKAIVRGIYLESGDYFNLKKIKASYKYLASLPIIQTANISFIEIDSISKLADSVKYIDCEIKLTQDKLQALEGSSEFTHTYGNLGIAGNLNYTHNNFFRNTESLNLKINGELKRMTKNPNYDIITDSTIIFNSNSFGVDLSMKFPRLFLPLPLKKFFQRSNPKTIANANISFTNRPDYSSSIAGGAMSYSFNLRTTTNITAGPAADFLKVNKHLDQVDLGENYEDRFVLGLPFKFTFNNQLNTKKKNYFYIAAYSKFAGNLLFKAMEWSNQEKVDDSYIVFGNAFAQFFKTDLDIRYYRKINRTKDNLVFRFFAGAALPYGNLNLIPFTEQYSSGGANGIRAWDERSIGPGSFVDTSSTTSPVYDQRSDIKLEGNIEYRMKLFGKFEGALFIDAGNIWAINDEDKRTVFDINNFYKEIAIGSGFGVRWDFDFLIVRLDIGLKVKDPALIEGNRWIPLNDMFKTNNMKLNIGIGYPF